MTLTAERIDKRLARLFVELFPDAQGRDLETLTRDDLAGWDSIATLTVFALAERDFGVKIGLDRVASVHSYSELRAVVSARLLP